MDNDGYMSSTQELISTAEVAELAGKSVWTVGRWAKSETHPLTPAWKGKGPRGGMLFNRADVEAALAKASTTTK